MTLRHMKIFVCVFQQKGITKAAQTLHLAQPSVSLAIRELENYYGVRLFERMGRRIYPTECGKEFYGYALHIVSLFEEMEKKITNWNRTGKLKLGASITIGTHILPEIIKEYQQLYPNLTVETTINQSSIIEQMILDNSVDLGLIETYPAHSDLLYEPFTQDDLCAIVAPSHPLTHENSVTLSQMAQYPFLVREKGSAVRAILDACLSLQQVSAHFLWESASTQAIVKGVAEGIGVSVLPYLLVKKDLDAHIIQQLPLAQPIKRDLNIIYHKSKYMTSPMRDFVNLCKQLNHF